MTARRCFVIIAKLSDERAGESGPEKTSKESEKNILTNTEMCDTICKLSSRGESEQDLEN